MHIFDGVFVENVCRLQNGDRFVPSLNGLTLTTYIDINTLRPRQNGRHFADDTFKRIFLNENVRISIKISLKFVPKASKGPINNITALVHIMACAYQATSHYLNL